MTLGAPQEPVGFDAEANALELRLFNRRIRNQHLENIAAILEACRRLRQLPLDERCELAASLTVAARTLKDIDEAVHAVIDDPLFLTICLQERDGALERLAAMNARPPGVSAPRKSGPPAA